MIRVFEIVGYVDVLLPRPPERLRLRLLRLLLDICGCRLPAGAKGRRSTVNARGSGRKGAGEGRVDANTGKGRDGIESPHPRENVPYVENSSRLPQNRAEFLQLRMRPDR